LSAACNQALSKSAANKMKDITLSHFTVERRITNVEEDAEMQFINEFVKSKLFALETDEFTDIQNNSMLPTYMTYRP
jgi:hypothetical protein